MRSVLASGASIPALGVTTAPLHGRECRQTVATALELGYRYVDTGERSDNEAAVRDAMTEATVPREEVFVATELLGGVTGREAVRSSFERSRTRLGLDYVDLLVVPSPSEEGELERTMAAANELQAEGRLLHVGASGFTVGELRTAMAASRTPVVAEHVEYNPYRDRPVLHRFCHEHELALTARAPLAGGAVADDETLREIGDAHDVTAAQVALRWLVQQPNVVALPVATSPGHLRENREVFDFELTDEEMRTVAALGGESDRERRESSRQ